MREAGKLGVTSSLRPFDARFQWKEEFLTVLNKGLSVIEASMGSVSAPLTISMHQKFN